MWAVFLLTLNKHNLNLVLDVTNIDKFGYSKDESVSEECRIKFVDEIFQIESSCKYD